LQYTMTPASTASDRAQDDKAGARDSSPGGARDSSPGGARDSSPGGEHSDRTKQPCGSTAKAEACVSEANGSVLNDVNGMHAVESGRIIVGGCTSSVCPENGRGGGGGEVCTRDTPEETAGPSGPSPATSPPALGGRADTVFVPEDLPASFGRGTVSACLPSGCGEAAGEVPEGPGAMNAAARARSSESGTTSSRLNNNDNYSEQVGAVGLKGVTGVIGAVGRTGGRGAIECDVAMGSRRNDKGADAVPVGGPGDRVQWVPVYVRDQGRTSGSGSSGLTLV
jgi:hypothetical protein